MSSRITSSMLSSNYLRNVNRNLTNMKTLQNQLASGKEIQRASDNAAKTSKIMQMHAEISYNKQYNENINDVSNWLDTTDTALGQLGNVFGRIESLLVNAGNAAFGPDERKAIQDEVKEKVNELSQILNTSFDGEYIFGGTKTTSKPTTVVNGVLQYAGSDEKAIKIPAYKDTNGKITSSNGSTQYGSTGLFTLDPTQVSDLNSELSSSSTSAERKQDINNILAAAGAGAATPVTLYYSGTTIPMPTATTIPASELTLEKTASNPVLAGLSTDQKKALISERDSSVTTASRKEDITKMLQGGTIYYSGTLPMPTPTETIPVAQLTSEKYVNKEVILSATDVTNLQKELSGLNYAAVAGTPDYKRIDDINSLLYNTNTSAGGLSLSAIRTNQATLKDLPAATTPAAKKAAIDALDAVNNVMGINQTNSRLNVDIAQGVATIYNKTAVDIMEFTDRSGKSINVSELLKNIVMDLGNDGSRNNLTGSHLKDIQSVTNNLLQHRSEVGAMENRMESAKDNNDTQNYNMTDILSKTEDIDFAEKTMEYSMMQTVYTASLQTSAKILPQTLMTYL